MAGPGVALRLHEFRESQDCSRLDVPVRSGPSTPGASRQGSDMRGLYPGQLFRVHAVHAKDCGTERSPSLQQPLTSQTADYQRGFDLCTLQALNVLSHSPAVRAQRPPQTTYQEEFGLQAQLFHK